MAAGTTIQSKRKAGAFTGSQLAAGEIGVDTDNELIAFSVEGTTITAVDERSMMVINQTTHGFAVGDILYDNAGTWAKARADASSTANVVGIVIKSVDANNFVLMTHGYFSGFTGLTANTGYFLSTSTAGAAQSTAPTAVGHVSLPVYWATSTTAAVFNPQRGIVITDTAKRTRTVSLAWNAPGDDATTGTKKAYFSVPEDMDGMNLVDCHAEVATAGTTGTMTFDININGTTALSTKLTIDTGETGSDTAASAHVINTAADNVSEFDVVSVDVDGIHTTAAKGEVVTMTFQDP